MYNWEIAEAYLKENPLVQQHIDSYNEFIDHGIHDVVNQQEAIETDKGNLEIKFHEIRAEQPVVTEADGAQRNILPNEARLRNRTYSAPLYLEISLEKEDEEIDREEVYVGELPVMIKSKLCYLSEMDEDELVEANEDPEDPGGYFIINGSERVLVGIENIAPNRIITSLKERNGKKNVKTRVFSSRKGYRGRVTVNRKHNGEMKISYWNSPRNLNLFHVLRALGLETKNDIMEAFSDEEYIINDVLLNLEQIEDSIEEDPIEALGKRVAKGQEEEYRDKTVKYHLNNLLLKHVGRKSDTWINKAYYLVRVAEKSIKVAKGIEEPDDKDHYSNKRIKISVNLIQEQFRNALRKFAGDVKYQVDRTSARGRKLKIKTLTRPDALSDRISFAFKTGTWVGGKTGVSQTLDRTSYMAQLSHLRRVSSPLSGKGKLIEPRDLHGTHYGKICPHETPEGGRVGLIKNLAVGCKISAEKIDQNDIEEELRSIGVEEFEKPV